MLSSTSPDAVDKADKNSQLMLRGLKENFMKFVVPGMFTMMCGTFTYPVAVRAARKIFKLRGFYAIHISIAPFLAFAHVNIFGTLHGLMRASVIEEEFVRLTPVLLTHQSSITLRKDDPNFTILTNLITSVAKK